MFRARHRPEKNARASAKRGSVGSARVWDDKTRALRVAGPAQDRAEAPLGPPPDELAALIQGIVRVTLDTRLTELERPRRAALAAELERRLLELFRPSTPASAAPGASPRPAPPLELPLAGTASERGMRKLRAKPGRTLTSSPEVPTFVTSSCKTT